MEDRISEMLFKLKSIRIAENQFDKLIVIKSKYEQQIFEIEDKIDYYFRELEKTEKTSFLSINGPFKGVKANQFDTLKEKFHKIQVERNQLYLHFQNAHWEIELLEKVIKQKDQIVDTLKLEVIGYELEFNNNNLKSYKELLQTIGYKSHLLKELEESLKLSLFVIKKYNAILRFIKQHAENAIALFNDPSFLDRIKFSDLTEYQKYLFALKNSLEVFYAELDDVYNAIQIDQKYHNPLVVNFVFKEKANLIMHLDENSTLIGLIQIITSHKSIILNLSRSLRRDKTVMKKELVQLEDKCNKVLNEMLM